MLPNTYKRLEYIESTGTQYINSGVSIINGSLKAQMRLNWSDISTTMGMGFSTTGGYLFEIYAGKYALSGSIIGEQVVVGRIDDIEFIKTNNNTSLSVNGTTPITMNSGTTTLNLGLFSMSATGLAFGTKCKMYSCKIYDGNNTLVRDFMPALRISDNVAGLYDLVNDQFYTNQGTGTFLYQLYKITGRKYLIGE